MSAMRIPTLRWAVAITLAALSWLAVLPRTASAQASGGGVSGRVQDDKKSPLPGVTISATQKGTGLNRVTTTTTDGSFHIGGLPVGTYKVTAELAGFATVNVDEVQVIVATDRSIEVSMSPSTVAESITVVDEAPLVETTAAIGTVVSQKELENLPLNGRQFANLATLAPGTQLSVNSDPTKPGQQTIALNGGSGRNVNFLVDGGDNTDDTIGGALQNFNLEAVQEFKIQTQQYKAEYGRTTGGVLSVVTKSGTNQLAGSAYGFFRDKSLNSETTTEETAKSGKQPYRRDQYGASIGGPIVQDKLHFFGTWEKTDRKTSYTIATQGVLPDLDGQSVPIPFTDELGTAKLSYDISAKQYLQVRYGYQKNSDKYGASPTSAPSSLGTVTNDYKSLLVGHTWQVGTEALNEILFQYTKFINTISADSNQPSLIFPSGVTEGQNINTPQATRQTKYQYKDDFSWSQTIGGHRHDFKAGLNYIDEPVLEGDFSTGLSGQYTLLRDDANSPVTDININGGFNGQKTPIKQYNAFVQDDWYASDRLTVNLGVRYDLWKGYDLDQRDNPIWQVLSTQTTFHEGYLQDFQGGKGGQLKNDTNNFGPRVGVTYDLKGDGKHLLRGGWGIYYDFPYTNATILFPASAVQSNYGTIYTNHNGTGILNPDGTFFHPGQTLPPNQVHNTGPPIPNEVASPTLATPESTQISLGYSWEVNKSLGFNFEGVDIHYRDLPFRFKINSLLDANGNTTVTALNPSGTKRFPGFSTIRLWYGKGQAKYQGINLGAHARGKNFQFQGFYTYSTTDGNVLAGADEFRLTDVGHQPDLGTRRDFSIDSQDPLCGACFGPLDTDAHHKLTLSGLYQLPLAFSVSGIFRYRSAEPYSVLLSTDANHDGSSADLAPGVSHVNSARGESFSQFDLRFGKQFSFGGRVSAELIAEIFNVFNAKNPNGIGNRYDPNTGALIGQKVGSYAGDPLQGEQRLAQLGLRIQF